MMLMGERIPRVSDPQPSETPDELRARLLGPSDSDAQMVACYYSFDRTGVSPVDAILSAVAVAGKAYHHTEWWNDEDYPPSQRDRIQQAARDAAVTIDALLARLATADAAHEDAYQAGYRSGVEAQAGLDAARLATAEADADRLDASGWHYHACPAGRWASGRCVALSGSSREPVQASTTS
jgi:hypothetical protein